MQITGTGLWGSRVEILPLELSGRGCWATVPIPGRGQAPVAGSWGLLAGTSRVPRTVARGAGPASPGHKALVDVGMC